jgi:hypothetical protein
MNVIAQAGTHELNSARIYNRTFFGMDTVWGTVTTAPNRKRSRAAKPGDTRDEPC